MYYIIYKNNLHKCAKGGEEGMKKQETTEEKLHRLAEIDRKAEAYNIKYRKQLIEQALYVTKAKSAGIKVHENEVEKIYKIKYPEQ